MDFFENCRPINSLAAQVRTDVGNCVVSGFRLCTSGHRLRQRAASRVWPLDHLAYLLP